MMVNGVLRKGLVSGIINRFSAKPSVMPDPTLLQLSSQTSAQKPVSTDQALLEINRDLMEKNVSERAKTAHLPYVNLNLFPVNPDVLHFVLPEDAKKGVLMPFFKSGKKIRIAVADPEKKETLETLRALKEKGYETEMHLASETSIQKAQTLYASEMYKPKEEMKHVADENLRYEQELKNLKALKEKVEQVSAEEGLNILFVGGIQAGTSDIHFQPEEHVTSVRFRIDGVLHAVFDLAPNVYANLANQLKYRAKMKLNITDIPQDGRFSFTVNERKIDVRISSLPTSYGETFACRILDTGKHFDNFEALGFSGRSLELLDRATSISYGMVLATGPTSSGKTTTLYTLLQKFNTPEVKIITLEDPIEYHLPGIVQSQVEEKRGYSFASGIRAIVRQDPDIVMIGEIRDLQTAETAAQAALTGHVVLSTLHTSSAVDAIPRLTTMGVPSFVIAPALNSIIAQRLVRRICVKCTNSRAITLGEKRVFESYLEKMRALSINGHLSVPTAVKEGKGCDECNGTGYRGQMVISEVFVVNDEAKEAILANASSAKLFEIARKQGMMTMGEDGISKAMAGLTTIEEVHRVTATL